MPSNTVKSHFVKSSPDVRAAYDAVLNAARALGSVREESKLTSIHLVNQSAFAGVAVQRDSLLLTLKATARINHPRIEKAEKMSANRWYVIVRVYQPDDVDHELEAWLAASFSIAAETFRKITAPARAAAKTQTSARKAKTKSRTRTRP